jgi:Cytochrome c oxidase subunit IIa family
MSESESEVGRHPIGTLAIVGVYGVLFVVGWLVVYVYVYLSRGVVTP